MLQRFIDPAAVAAEIERVRSLSGPALRRRWQSAFGRSHEDQKVASLRKFPPHKSSSARSGCTNSKRRNARWTHNAALALSPRTNHGAGARRGASRNNIHSNRLTQVRRLHQACEARSNVARDGACDGLSSLYLVDLTPL